MRTGEEDYMILLGCLLALTAVVMPRVVLIGAWIFADRWVLVWDGAVLMPLLGIAFLPYTTIMYILVWHPDGIVGYAWVWLLMGFTLDLLKWGHVLTNRERGMEYVQRYYPSSGNDNKDDAAES
jgi:hypothetical protein